MNLTRLTFKETLKECKNFIENSSMDILYIDTDMIISQDCIFDLLEKEYDFKRWEGPFFNGGIFITQDVLLVKAYSSGVFNEYADYIRKEGKRLLFVSCLVPTNKLPENIQIIVCENEYALTVGEVVRFLKTIENPEQKIPVYTTKIEREYFAEPRTNGGISDRSIMLCCDESGPATTVTEFLSYLSQFPEEARIELINRTIPTAFLNGESLCNEVPIIIKEEKTLIDELRNIFH